MANPINILRISRMQMLTQRSSAEGALSQVNDQRSMLIGRIASLTSDIQMTEAALTTLGATY